MLVRLKALIRCWVEIIVFVVRFSGRKWGVRLAFLIWIGVDSRPAYGVYAGQVKNLNKVWFFLLLPIMECVPLSRMWFKLEIHILKDLDEREWGTMQKLKCLLILHPI